MTGKAGTTVALAVAALMLLSACAGTKGPPDPAKVQEEMTATLEEEKELIRSWPRIGPTRTSIPSKVPSTTFA